MPRQAGTTQNRNRMTISKHFLRAACRYWYARILVFIFTVTFPFNELDSVVVKHFHHKRKALL